MSAAIKSLLLQNLGISKKYSVDYLLVNLILKTDYSRAKETIDY